MGIPTHLISRWVTQMTRALFRSPEGKIVTRTVLSAAAFTATKHLLERWLPRRRP